MWIAGRWWNKPLIGLGAVVAVALIVVGAWAADGRAHRGEPMRNVALDGRLVGGIDSDGLAGIMAEMAERVASTAVTVELGDRTLDFLARDLGIVVDVEATQDAVLREGRNGPWLDRVSGWLFAFDERREVDLVLAFDEDAARASLSSHPLMVDRQPVHPAAVFDGERLVAVDGAPGRGLDPDVIMESLQVAVADGDVSNVTGAWREIPSPIPFGQAQALVAGISDRVGSGVIVEMADTVRWLPAKPLYSWMSSTTEAGQLELVFDGQEALRYVEGVFSDVWVGDIHPTFDVVDGEPLFAELGDRRSVCCAADVVPMLVAVVEGDVAQPLEVPVRAPTEDEGLAVARGLGVTELVGEFTTEHACCASRVINIHRIADILRGHVIPPGESLSINEFVGRRTRANGFVSAGVIQSGRFDDAVGGGISQFATTIFNAAFFAGLDIPEYQSHSIYISRYPYGREATVSFPAPDLVIENTTPHHVLIWTTYTDTSITVQMYSTRHAEVEEVGQSVGSVGACTSVETFRARTYPDGSVIEDSVIATYRPGEGLDCRGRPTPQP